MSADCSGSLCIQIRREPQTVRGLQRAEAAWRSRRLGPHHACLGIHANPDHHSIKGDSENVVLQIDKPYFNHNGGCIQFGPDGYLYMSVGDGGNGNDQGKRPPEGNGQNLQTALGNSSASTVECGPESRYGIPKDNPSVGKQAARRFSPMECVTPGGCRLIRAAITNCSRPDVGQDSFEEVDIIRKGGNYGWNVREASIVLIRRTQHTHRQDCSKTAGNGDPFVDPIFEYKELQGASEGSGRAGHFDYGGDLFIAAKAIAAIAGQVCLCGLVAPSGSSPKECSSPQPGASMGNGLGRKISPASHPKGIDFYITVSGEDADHELYLFTNNSNGLVGDTGTVYKIGPI
jgi:hypothetical protein